MSRTIRRKNSWNRHHFTSDWFKESAIRCWGDDPFWGRQRMMDYHQVRTIEQAQQRTVAHYHSDAHRAGRNSYIRKESLNHIRTAERLLLVKVMRCPEDGATLKHDLVLEQPWKHWYWD